MVIDFSLRYKNPYDAFVIGIFICLYGCGIGAVLFIGVREQVSYYF
jgi:hypothetical protein